MAALVLQGDREFVDAARATALLAPFKASSSFYRISLRNKSYSLEAAKVLANFLKTIPNGLRVADLADMIAGRPEDEALLVLENVCRSLKGHQLVEIDLSDNALGEKGVRACFDILLEQYHLEKLFLCNNGLSAESAKVVADVLLFRGDTKLKTFHFYNNMSGDGGAKALATLIPHCPELEDLRFSTTRAQREGCRVFANALSSLKNLKHVDLSDNTFGEQGATVLAKGLGLQSKLEVLNLRDASIGDDGLIAISKALLKNKVTGIRVLDVSGNDLTEASMEALGQLVAALPQLEELRIEENEIGSDGAQKLARFLHKKNVISKLRVFQSNTNEISSVGAWWIANALANNSALERVELDGNMLTEETIEKIKELFTAHKKSSVLVEMEDNMEDDDEDDIVLEETLEWSEDEADDQIEAITSSLAATTIAPSAKLEFPAKREVVDANRAHELLAPFRNQTQLYSISLRGKSYTIEGAHVMAEYLRKIEKGLKIADLADIIAGRPENEALLVLTAISKSLSGHILDTIDLSDNALGEKGVRACFDLLIPQPNLKHLLFENNGISAAAAAVIAKDVTLQASQLETFSFFNNMSGHDGCIAIASMLSGLPHLTKLRYASARAGIKASCELAKSIAKNLTKLVELDLSDCSFDEEGAQALADAIRKQPNLKVLKLRDASLGPDGAMVVVNAISNLRLTSLDLSGNELEDEGMSNIVSGPHSLEAQMDLTVLRLDENECTSKGLAVFADEIRASLPKLEELSLCGNEITASGAVSLIKSGLANKSALQHLYLDSNMISTKGIEMMNELLKKIGKSHVLDRLGDGAFGEVLKARSLKTNEIVAIKKMKALFPTWEECLQLRELKSLKILRHDNIIQLKEVIRDKAELYFVFEYMETSLFVWMRKHPNAHENDIRSIMNQLFAGLAYMHKHGFFHRDIKPENCLLNGDVLKIADLGQAREIRSRPPFTDYVSTRWYRSPELLLRSSTYNSPIDLWACGCIMAELYLGKPLFAGSSEADQMCRICSVLGTPTKENWPEGVTMVSQMQFK
ncbi:hypothetical protein THRCLA_07598 [Thraustotheca clavata]|uniref:Protein kinase domain-containing protein n=1 Tax=Thraustotheca clavata TaxID=74557 RepID=A0A1V9ZCM6_9STRA|nr:hypothetical protein THRCLA_07598 [Thraustotheca clavata]